MRIVAIVQARMGSTRLPGETFFGFKTEVLFKGEAYLFEHIIDKGED